MDGSSCTGPLMRAILEKQVIVASNSGSLLFDLILIFVLILINGFFSAAEMAVVTQNDNRIRQMAQSGHSKAKRLLRFVDNKSRFLSTTQVAITIAGFLSSAFAADKIAGRIYTALDPLYETPSLRTIAVIGLTILLSYISMVLGELVPKRLAMRRPEALALSIAGILRGFDIFFYPFTRLLEFSGNVVIRLFGIDPSETAKQVTEEEIRILVEAGTEAVTFTKRKLL